MNVVNVVNVINVVNGFDLWSGIDNVIIMG